MSLWGARDRVVADNGHEQINQEILCGWSVHLDKQCYATRLSKFQKVVSPRKVWPILLEPQPPKRESSATSANRGTSECVCFQNMDVSSFSSHSPQECASNRLSSQETFLASNLFPFDRL